METLPLEEQAMLTTLLTQPHRHYHNINHVNDCLVEFYRYETDTAMLTYGEADALRYAIWYHDSIYNPYAPHGMNERQSADLFFHKHRQLGDIANTVSGAIVKTAKHTITQSNLFKITQVLLDIDLSGLGKPMHIFAKNSYNIRLEYYNTTDMDVVKGRLTFFEKLNKRESFYYTDYFRELYHEQSKTNVALEMEALTYALEKNDADWYFEKLDSYCRIQ